MNEFSSIMLKYFDSVVTVCGGHQRPIRGDSDGNGGQHHVRHEVIVKVLVVVDEASLQKSLHTFSVLLARRVDSSGQDIHQIEAVTAHTRIPAERRIVKSRVE